MNTERRNAGLKSMQERELPDCMFALRNQQTVWINAKIKHRGHIRNLKKSLEEENKNKDLDLDKIENIQKDILIYEEQIEIWETIFPRIYKKATKYSVNWFWYNKMRSTKTDHFGSDPCDKCYENIENPKPHGRYTTEEMYKIYTDWFKLNYKETKMYDIIGFRVLSIKCLNKIYSGDGNRHWSCFNAVVPRYL
jgi:hypothetical protein